MCVSDFNCPVLGLLLTEKEDVCSMRVTMSSSNVCMVLYLYESPPSTALLLAGQCICVTISYHTGGKQGLRLWAVPPITGSSPPWADQSRAESG